MSFISDLSKNFDLKYLFIIYLALVGAYFEKTTGCRLREFLDSSMVYSHLIGFFSVLFFVVLTSNEPSTDRYAFFKKVLATALVYIIFIISSKADYKFFIAFIILIAISFIIQSYADSLDPEMYKEEIELYNKIARYIKYLSIVILVLGFFLYLGEKKFEYGGKNWSTYKFILGTNACKGETPTLSTVEKLKGIFM
jgi:hypothetical protein